MVRDVGAGVGRQAEGLLGLELRRARQQEEVVAAPSWPGGLRPAARALPRVVASGHIVHAFGQDRRKCLLPRSPRDAAPLRLGQGRGAAHFELSGRAGPRHAQVRARRRRPGLRRGRRVPHVRRRRRGEALACGRRLPALPPPADQGGPDRWRARRRGGHGDDLPPAGQRRGCPDYRAGSVGGPLHRPALGLHGGSGRRLRVVNERLLGLPLSAYRPSAAPSSGRAPPAPTER
mmetsp:Transcript_919/g.2403  ORF Transcript_919/g.2403 Transcript_919/m.2403 type:complete len:233 (+) Transcript_919:1818-2516(+)